MKEDPEMETSGRNWFYIISPFIIAAALAVIVIIDSSLDMERSGGLSFIGVMIGVPVLLFGIVFDLILKSLVKKKALYVWIIEATIIIVIIFMIKDYFG